MAKTYTTTARVLQIDEAVSKTGKAYWKVLLNGPNGYIRSYCWSSKLASLLREDENMMLELEDGKFPRIIAVNETRNGRDSKEGEMHNNGEQQAQEKRDIDAKENRMLKMSALCSAAEVMQGSKIPAEKLVEYAQQLLDWLMS